MKLEHEIESTGSLPDKWGEKVVSVPNPNPANPIRIKPGSMASYFWPDKKFFQITFEGDDMQTALFWDMANLYFPKGCQCGNNGDGSCDWCRVYYGDDKPWIDEEGRELPLPKEAKKILKGEEMVS